MTWNADPLDTLMAHSLSSSGLCLEHSDIVPPGLGNPIPLLCFIFFLLLSHLKIPPIVHLLLSPYLEFCFYSLLNAYFLEERPCQHNLQPIGASGADLGLGVESNLGLEMPGMLAGDI
jgi:hypothetical protein